MSSNSKTDQLVGMYEIYPDSTKQRRAVGGIRTEQNYSRKTSQMPLVSVVTVVFNAAETLERTIQSVLAQDYGNIEYIIIDGGSTDDSIDIIKKYGSEIEYYLSEPDTGIYNAMNKGISLAAGDYICLLNADDFYHADFISNSVQTAKNTGADIVYSAISWFGYERYPVEINDGILMYHMNINHMTFLVSKNAYEQVGLYNEDFTLFSDDLWTRTAYLKGMKFVYNPRIMVVFTGGGLSAGNTPEKRRVIFEESGEILRLFFPFLNQEEAENIIQSRFNLSMIDKLDDIYERYAEKNELFKTSFSCYIDFALKFRENFIFNKGKIQKYLTKYQNFARKLEVPFSSFHFTDIEHSISDIFQSILAGKKALEDKGASKIILHFVAQFSRPSETFIYDLIQRLEGESWCFNFVLCDKRILIQEREFDNYVQIDWQMLPKPVRNMLYEFLFMKLNPDVIITHFALNGWWLHERLKKLSYFVPTIHMTHGIDVFTISTKPKYRDFILNYASVDPNTQFTAVSNYLRNELIYRGVPAEKISLTPNVIHDRFFEHRKRGNYFDGSGVLNVLNIGRIVGWKGHIELLEGLKYFIDNVSDDIVLTIVYGKDTSGLNDVEEKCIELQLAEHVRFVDFVDFNKQPDFFTNFDIFISASKYSEGVTSRSETFGMSTLEAIAAGLPVIVTDAGGSPEVVGGNGSFVKIVPCANGFAIGKALEDCVADKNCFSDNMEYAKERLAQFNGPKQIEQIKSIIERVTSKKLKVGSISSIIQGGAGRAASRVHKALLMNNVESTFITRYFKGQKPAEPNYTFLKPSIGMEFEELQSRSYYKKHHTLFSINEPSLTRESLRDNVKNLDVINVQWVARFLSIEDIGYLSNLGKPLICTVRDMHPLTGGCHFFHGCQKWQKDCFGCPQLQVDFSHYPSKVFSLKKKLWNTKNITVIALSNHTKRILKQSPILQDCRIEIIGNPLNLEEFSPEGKEQAREYFNFNNDIPTIFYLPSYGSKVKGAKEFKEALMILKEKYPDVKLQLMVAGSATNLVKESDYPFPIIKLGGIRDNRILAKAYSAADITAIPSLEETFSNTAAESIACGTPIVGFNTGAIQEIAGNGLRGQSVEVGHVNGLADAIYNNLGRGDLSKECRDYAELHFTFADQGKKYLKLYHELLQSPQIAPHYAPEDIPIISQELFVDTYNYQTKTNFTKRAADKREQAHRKKLDIEKYVKSIDKKIFENSFREFRSIPFKRNPIKKVYSYKRLLAVWHFLQKKRLNKLTSSQDFSNNFNGLIHTSLILNPWKKLHYYKNLMKAWRKYNRKN